MKIVINRAFGGFEVPEELVSVVGDRWDCDRTMPELVKWVEEHEDDTDLGVEIIPDEATDYEILEYDGLETVIYVVDGKLYYV